MAEDEEVFASSFSSRNRQDAIETLSPIKTLLGEYSTVIFTKTKCSYCKNVKEHFQLLGHDYHEVRLDIPAGFKYVSALRDMTSQTTVPYIFVKGKFIGGASELMARGTKL